MSPSAVPCQTELMDFWWISSCIPPICHSQMDINSSDFMATGSFPAS